MVPAEPFVPASAAPAPDDKNFLFDALIARVERQPPRFRLLVVIEHIHMLQGAFMGMLQPGSPLIDYDEGTVPFWGDGKQPIELTTVEDTARMTARVALDRDVPSGKFAFAGDRLSFQQVADIAEAQTGKTFKRHSLGNEQQLRSKMKQIAASDPGQAIMLAYQLYMLNGQTSLDDLQSDRYPDLGLQTYASFLAEQLVD